MKKQIRRIGIMLVLLGTVCGVQAQNMKDGHEYVDLGLPSGTLWATCNIGATSGNEAGSYFAWGEIEQSDWFDWDNYKWGDYDYLTKYNGNPKYGTVDNRGQLQPRDDAAHMIWGGEWRIPSLDDANELIDNSTFWYDGESMMIVKGPNGNTVNFYLGGYMEDDHVSGLGIYGNYWISEIYDLDYSPQLARSIFFCFDGRFTWTMGSRCPGYNIRPVCPGDPSDISSPIISDKVNTIFYNMNGSRLNGAQKGVNIFKSSDGKVRKLFIK